MSGGRQKCPGCSKTVYFAEKRDGLNGDWWHRGCFKCAKCKHALEPGGFSENGGQIYCKKCYGSVIGLQGYGFGGGGGTLASYQDYGHAKSQLDTRPTQAQLESPADEHGSEPEHPANFAFCPKCGSANEAAGGNCAGCGFNLRWR